MKEVVHHVPEPKTSCGEPAEKKVTAKKWNKVTCKNCLKTLKRLQRVKGGVQ